jgi:hypothetical protein
MEQHPAARLGLQTEDLRQLSKLLSQDIALIS